MGHSDPYIDFGREYLQGSLKVTIFLQNFVSCKKKISYEFFSVCVNDPNDRLNV